MEQMLYGLSSDSIYLNPIIDVTSSAKDARERLWRWRKLPSVKADGQRILSIHVGAKRGRN